jgi:hypothetical protein
MQRKFFSLTGLVVVLSLLVAVPGIGQITGDPGAAAATAAVSLVEWNADPSSISTEDLFAMFDSNPGVPDRTRAFVMQRIIAEGDPALGAFDAQTYLDAAAAGDAGAERSYAWARAGIFASRGGFGAVPGGPSESFNRIQTCLNDSDLVSNQGNVGGNNVDCSSGVIRQAVAEMIAIGFYQQFGGLVGIDCDSLATQSSDGGTAESRYAATTAFNAMCTDGMSTAELIASVGTLAIPARAAELSDTAQGELFSIAFSDSGVEGAAAALAAGLQLVAAGNSSQIVPGFGDLATFSSLFGETRGFGAAVALARVLDASSNLVVLLTTDGGMEANAYFGVSL